MRAYDIASEEALHARDLLKDWAGEGFITEAQKQQLESEAVCEFRRTNIFLRVVLFLFTLLIVGAAAGLFFVVFLPGVRDTTIGIFLLVFAPVCYAAAEVAISQFHFYRHGIEEAFLSCSVGLLCGGVVAAWSHSSSGAEFLVPAAGAIASLWIWHRFGLWYAFLAAMIFSIWLPDTWTSSHSARHVIVAALYAFGLIAVVAVRPRHRLTVLDQRYSIAEALLWLGVYVAINLQLSSVDLLRQWWEGPQNSTEFPRMFHWTTWVLTWCLPPVVLVRGLRTKDRFVMAVGGLAAILTLATNKPYLGWQRHTWDPILLGALLIGVAIGVRRWLAQGPGQIRHGFTAQRLSGKDKDRMSAGAAAIGFLSPSAITPSQPQEAHPDVHYGGGDSGGGGASSDF